MDTVPRVIVAEPSNAFADEEADPPYGYRSGYKKPEPLEVQIASFFFSTWCYHYLKGIP